MLIGAYRGFDRLQPTSEERMFGKIDESLSFQNHLASGIGRLVFQTDQRSFQHHNPDLTRFKLRPRCF